MLSKFFSHDYALASRILPLAALAGALFVFSVPDLALARPEMAGGKSVEDRYAAMDANSDGKVTSEEFFAAFPQMKEGAFKTIDANGDGGISLEEWLGFAAGHKSSDPHAGMGAMGGAAAQGEKSVNGTAGSGGEGMPSLIMPPGVGK